LLHTRALLKKNLKKRALMAWLRTEIWHGPTVIGSYQSQPELEQAVFRTTLGALALLIYYGYAAGRIDSPTLITLQMMALYVIFCVVTWISVRCRPALSTIRLTTTTTVDQGMAVTALALGGRSALPLLFIVFWFLVGTGCRYGKRPLMLSCSIAVAGFLQLMLFEPWWMANRQVGTGLLLAVVATSFYLYVLVNKLEHRAATDPLTGLLNRSSFERVIEHAQLTTKRHNGDSALLLIDLDGFKEVNDALGHAAGDDLLQTFATRLAALAGRGDAIARLGGDEFAYFVRHSQQEQEAIRAIAASIHNAIETISLPGSRGLLVTASIGVCVPSSPEKNERPAAGILLRNADHAMYSAKMSGRGRTVFWDDGRLRQAAISEPIV
jgi:diguanylate cyclase (GGDEF)-like protein